MGNDPILTLSQSVVLNLYTMVTIDWYRRKESNLHFLVRSEGYTPLYDSGKWWRWTGSNRRHLACKANALPTELHPQFGGPKGNRTPADGVTSRYTNRYTMGPNLVETTGVEPVVPFGRRIYSPLGLPIFLHLQNR